MPTGDSSSSVRSIRSIQSNTTVKAISPPTTVFPYTVGKASTFHDTDTDMDDPFSMSMPTHAEHHRHRIDSQGVPIPPARTTSLGQHAQSHSVSSSDTSLPSVQVTNATPTKRSSKNNNNQHPYQGHGHGHGYDQPRYSNTFGHGSLDVTEDRGYSFPHYSSSTDQFSSYTSVEDDSDVEPALREMKVSEKEEDKLERQRRQGRERQRRKRARDKQDRQNSQVQVQPVGTTSVSRNPSNTSLAPIIVPNLNLNMNMNMNMSMTTMGSSTPSSSVYSSLPTSASFTSSSPNTRTHQAYSTSGASSPTAFLSPMTPATNSGQDGYPWTTTPNRASKSAVDVRTTQLSRSNTSTNHRPRMIAPPPHRVPLASSSTSSHSAKRRRSEPEPEQFKTKQVGLGMNMPPQDQGPVEFLSTPTDENGPIKPKERPGMRRTASDSAAVALEFSTHQSRSPTPPLLESLKSGYIPLEPLPQNQNQSQAGLLASVALTALVDNPSENVKRALTELKFTREGLLGLQQELSSFFGRFCLEKEMGAVSLEDRPNTSYPTTSGFTSNAATPYHENIALSATSTRQSSPMRMELIPTNSTSRPNTSKSTPKTSRARSLSSASMRARGLQMSSAKTSTTTHKSPALSLYQETLISPMSTTPYQFPNTPVTAMPDSDEASASPMMSAVQTPTTGQSQAFPHHEILAIGQGTMRVDQGRARHDEGGGGGGGGYQHQRSATEGGGKAWNHAPAHPHAHARTGSNWELQQTNHRPSASYSQSISQSHSMPGLSSPLDMPYRQAPIAPPPHLPPPPPSFEFAYPQHQHHHQNQNHVSPQVQPPTSFQTPSHRHHNSSSGLSTPFTPSPAPHHSHSHTHAGGGGIYQPTFTPIAEMGTPTRPSPREPRMLGYDPSSAGMGRLGEMDQMVLSPPQVQPGMMEGNWMAFGQVMPHTAPGTDAGGFGADSFGGNNQQR